MLTANFYVEPKDGWVLVASAPDFLSIEASLDNVPFNVWGGTSKPSFYAEGVFCQGLRFVMDVKSTDDYWVKTVDEPVRIDVMGTFDIPPPSDSAILMESSGYVLMEDGSKILLE